jgi:PPK2 family polyphosphate:nucleotide phosphotransferase
MKNVAERLHATGRNVRLGHWDPRSTPGCRNKQTAAGILARNLQRIDELQYRLYAEGRRSLLIVLQGMDTSGKDGVVRRVMTAFNPQSCRVWPFKAPTQEELAHDFLWRIHKATPPRGGVSIFNRSHYEDVLIVRVHKLVPKKVWGARYEIINQFERQLHENGTRIIKFFLHISPEEQRERLLARLDEPDKHWKFNEGDLAEREHWEDYHRAYDDVLERCSTDWAPWFVIPADRKWYRDCAIAQIVADTLADMGPQTPKVELDVQALRGRLEA